MNIGVFTIMLHSGGTERVIAKLSLMWSSLGHKVHFFTIRKPHDAEFPHECVVRDCAPEGGWTVADADRLQKEHGLDLVVFNGGWNNAWVEPLVCRFSDLKVRTLAILHHAFNNWAFAGCNGGDFDKDCLLSHLDCLVCVDKMQALWWSRRHRKVVYMPNPCALESQSVLPIGQSGEKGHKIVWIGRADDDGKRVSLAIEVFHEVRKRIPDAELTIIGALPKAWKCVEPGIKCVGYVPNTAEFLNAAAVHLVTTLWEVTVPQVILEAMAYGVPTVAFDLPVFRGVDGMWLGKDVDSVAALTVDVMSSPDKYNVLDELRKIADRNKEIEGRWGDLVKAFEAGDLSAYTEKRMPEYFNLDVYGQLLDEIQRSEAFAVATQLPLVNKARRWKARWAHLKQMVGL